MKYNGNLLSRIKKYNVKEIIEFENESLKNIKMFELEKETLFFGCVLNEVFAKKYETYLYVIETGQLIITSLNSIKSSIEESTVDFHNLVELIENNNENEILKTILKYINN